MSACSVQFGWNGVTLVGRTHPMMPYSDYMGMQQVSGCLMLLCMAAAFKHVSPPVKRIQSVSKDEQTFENVFLFFVASLLVHCQICGKSWFFLQVFSNKNFNNLRLPFFHLCKPCLCHDCQPLLQAEIIKWGVEAPYIKSPLDSTTELMVMLSLIESSHKIWRAPHSPHSVDSSIEFEGRTLTLRGLW